MATGYINASDANVLDNFTLAHGDLAEHSISVEEIATGDDPGITYPVKAIQIAIPDSNSWAFYAINDVPLAENWEIAGRIAKIGGGTINTDYNGFALRILPANQNLYWFGLASGSDVRVRRRQPYETFRQSIAQITTGVSNETFAYIRVRANGSNLMFKRWSAADAEPELWTWEGTNTAVSGDGGIAIGAFYGGSSQLYRWMDIGWATDGDTAPTGPVTAGPTTPTGLITTNITATGFRAGWTS